MINCLIIEDEVNARKVLLNYIEQTGDLQCRGCYGSGLEVPLEILNSVEFIFLDIELPTINGLAFLKSLTRKPKVIVTTAYPNYAVDAYEQAVIDYLVKPFSYERFLSAYHRLKSMIQPDIREEFIMVYADKTNHKLDISEILFLKSELDYVAITTKNQKILILDSLNDWEKKMKQHAFVRVHRSYLINLRNAKKIMANKVVMEGNEIPIGVTYRGHLQNIVSQYRV